MYVQCNITYHKKCSGQPAIVLFQRFIIIFLKQKSLQQFSGISKCTINFHLDNMPTMSMTVPIKFHSQVQLTAPTTDAIVLVRLFKNWAICFKSIAPISFPISIPHQSLDDNDIWLGLGCKVKFTTHTTVGFNSSLACRPGPGCWLLAPMQRFPSLDDSLASAYSSCGGSGDTGSGRALGLLIGSCTIGVASGGPVCPLLLPASQLAQLLGIDSTAPLLPTPLTRAPANRRLPACLLEVVGGASVLWGAATILGPRLAVTCAHLVATGRQGRIRLRPPGGGGWRGARLLWANRVTEPPVFDAAFLKLHDGESDLPDWATELGEGEASRLTGRPVTAVGFPFQSVSGRACQMLCHGTVVHEFGGQLRPTGTIGDWLTVAYQTSCPVFSGFSGGPVLLADSGAVAAMTVGHLRLHSPDRNFYDISLSIPIGLLINAAQKYTKTQDPETAFGELCVPLSVHSGWVWHAANNLLVQQNPGIRSKL